ncbi:MAG: cobalamin-dependent protein [bacterium]
MKPDTARFPSDESVRALEAELPALAAAASEKLALDARFECLGPGCENAALVEEYNRLFGRTYAALLDAGLVEHLAGEFDWLARVLMRRGFEVGFFPHMLDAWVLALNSRLSRPAATELTGPLDVLKRRPAAGASQASTAAVAPEARAFLDLLRARRRRGATGFLLERSSRTPGDRVRTIVQPALAEVGRLWEQNEMSVAEEHAATEVCRYALMRMYDQLPEPAPAGRVGLVGCVPGEDHEVGTWLVGAELERRGWDICYIGRGVPEDDLVRGIRAVKAEAAFLSSQHVTNLPATRQLVERLRRDLPNVRVVLGGHAANLAAERLARPGVAVVNQFDEADRAAGEAAGDA